MNDDQALSIDPAGAGNVWSVDADALLQSVLDRPDAPPLLRQALSGVLSWQTRNETPVRRTLTSPRLAPQWVAALLVQGATVTLDAEAGPSDVPLELLLEHRGEGAVAALHVPPGGPGRRWGEAHVARTPADEPIVAAFAVVDVETLWRHKETKVEMHWEGRTLKGYTKTADGWKLIMHAGVLDYSGM